MNPVHSFSCGFPFCQKNEGEQTSLSIIFRITAVIVGIIAFVVSALIFGGTPGLASLSTAYGWSLLALSIVLVVAGISIKCVKKNIDTQVDVKSTADIALDAKPKHNNPNVSASRSTFTTMKFDSSSYQSRQRKKIEEDLAATLNLEAKRKEQIEWYEKTNKEKEEEYQEALAKLKGKNLHATLEKKQIDSLTDKYNRGQEFRKQALDNSLLLLEDADKNAKRLANTLSGDNK